MLICCYLQLPFSKIVTFSLHMVTITWEKPIPLSLPVENVSATLTCFNHLQNNLGLVNHHLSKASVKELNRGLSVGELGGNTAGGLSRNGRGGGNRLGRKSGQRLFGLR